MGQFDVDTGSFTAEGQDRARAQQEALMGVIAQHGQAGAQAYAQGQQAIAAQGQAAQTASAGNAQNSAVYNNGDFAQQEQAKMSAIQNAYSQDNAAGATAFSQDMQRASNSNRDYMGQLSASIPLVAENTKQQAQALGSRAAAEQARREQERQLAELQLQMQREQIQAAREDRASKAEGKDDPLLDLKRQAMGDDHAAAEAALAQGAKPNPAADKLAIDKAYERARQDAFGFLGGSTSRSGIALQSILDGKPDMSIKTPGGRALDWQLIDRLARQIQTAGMGGTISGPNRTPEIIGY